MFSAASLMMFEGAVMATIQEMGGDYGIQRYQVKYIYLGLVCSQIIYCEQSVKK